MDSEKRITIDVDLIKRSNTYWYKLTFPYHEPTIQILRALTGSQLSNKLKCWLLPYQGNSISGITEKLGDTAYLISKAAEDVQRIIVKNEKAREMYETAIRAFKAHLQSRRYSGSTVKTNAEALQTFLRFIECKPFIRTDMIVINSTPG